jgi:hypothetical protein
MALHRLLLVGLVVVIILAPLPFGSVETWARGCLTAACLGLGILWVLWRSHSGLAPLPLKAPVLLAGALFMVVGVVQVIPFPRPVLQGLSPGAVEIRDRYESPTEPRSITQQNPPQPFAGARPISLDPWSTRRAVLLFIALVLVVLITTDLAGQSSGRRALVTVRVHEAVLHRRRYRDLHQQESLRWISGHDDATGDRSGERLRQQAAGEGTR